jgi:hypothetical protein
MSYGVKVAKSGKSVTSTNPNDYIFNSDYETIKIYSENTASINVNAGSYTDVSVTHGLDFVPMCWVFAELASGHFYCGVSIPSIADGFPSSYVLVNPDSATTYVDTTYLKIRVNNTTASTKSVKVSYFIFGDDGL